MKHALALLALLATPALGQVSGAIFQARQYDVTDLPTCNANRTGWFYGVYNAADADDCSVGSGANEHICLCNGTAWVAIPGTVTGAPTDADYLVGTANAGLSAEIVAGTAPGGELGGTWASPTVDATHSGSAHHSIFVPNADPGVDHSSYVAGHSDGANCSAAQSPLGVDSAGAAQSCWTPVSGPTSSTDNHLMVFSGTTGKVAKQMSSGTALLTPTLSVTGGLTTAGNLDVNGAGLHDIEGELQADAFEYEGNPGNVGAIDQCRAAGTPSNLGNCSSTGEEKRDVGRLGRAYSLGLVRRVEPVYFHWRRTGLPDLGLVAEQIASVHPQLATWVEGEPIQVNRNAMLAILVGAVQDLAARVEELEAQVSELGAQR